MKQSDLEKVTLSVQGAGICPRTCTSTLVEIHFDDVIAVHFRLFDEV
jgi:hypothetical protein